MLEYDPKSSLRHWPSPMLKFGATPYGEPMYRVVFAPSRRYLVAGQWPDGSVCAHWVPLYKRLGETWVMEKWRPASEICPEGKAYWDLHHSALGPWPERGDYEFCHAFETGTPDDANIEKLITWIAMGRTHSVYEQVVFHREQAEQERKSAAETAQDFIRNKLPAYGVRPFVGARVARGSKTGRVLKSANELGLPTSPGVLKTKPSRQRELAPQFERVSA